MLKDKFSYFWKKIIQILSTAFKKKDNFVMEEKEKRSANRFFDERLEVTYSLDKIMSILRPRTPVIVYDFSEQGLSLVSPRKLSKGAVIRLNIKYADESLGIIRAKVINVYKSEQGENGTRVGVHYYPGNLNGSFHTSPQKEVSRICSRLAVSKEYGEAGFQEMERPDDAMRKALFG